MPARVLATLHRVLYRPESTNPSVAMGLALAPPVAAGLLIFRLPAAEALGAAVAAGLAVQILCWPLRIPLRDSPLIAAVAGTAMVGAGAPLLWPAAVAVAAVTLEAVRGRFLPGAPVQVGFLAYAALLLVPFSAVASYLNPAGGGPLAEPIRLWLEYYRGPQAPIDPVRLYVGNVPGPLFATSLLAVVVGAAWLWYARRLSLLTVVAFGAGSLAPVLYYHWSPVYQLDSGPLWFAGALVLADRRNLPGPAPVRLLAGLAGGALATGLRARGYSIEAVPVAVVALQLAIALMAGAAWLLVGRRRSHRAGAGVKPGPGRPGPAAARVAGVRGSAYER